MAYENYLIKVGEYKIPHKFMSAESYSVYLNTQDMDPYRDGDGILRREVLEHKPPKVEFETPPLLTNHQFKELMSNIRENYIIPKERKVNAHVYIPETDSYITMDMYLADFQPTIYGIFDGIIQYQPIRLSFIGY